MTLFRYVAVGGSRGVVEAPTIGEARERLRNQGFLLKKIWEGKVSRKRSALKGDHLINFTLQLSQLIFAGMPIFESLVALEEQYRGDRCHPVLVDICGQIKRGRSLSEAMATHPESFNQLYQAMVAAGEASGSLAPVLSKLGDLLAKQGKMRKTLITSLTYPMVIAAFCLVVVFLLLTFAIPSISNLFEGHQINSFTQGVLSVSRFLSAYWIVYLPLTAAGIITAYTFFHSARWRHLVLRLPLLKAITIESALSRFSKSLATLLEGGVAAIDALRLARRVIMNEGLEEVISHAEEEIVKGSDLSVELGKSSLIPPLVPRMIRVGEESGELPAMLQRIGDLYAEELEKRLQRLVALAQPTILVVMGGVIGLIMLAVLLPLTDVSSLF